MEVASGVDKSFVASVQDIKLGSYSLLFCAPEAIVHGEHWRNMLSEEPLHSRVAALVIDEAHCVYKWGTDFRPSFARVHELRSLLPSSAPVLAATATVTSTSLAFVVKQLNMVEYRLVYVYPERSNIFYEVKSRTSIEQDLSDILTDLKANSVNATRVIIYCQSLNMSSDLYAHFLCELGDNSYYPPGAPKLCSNRLFGMYHSGTAEHNKDVIVKSMGCANGTVRVVFATVALGMGVNLAALNRIVHYGAPRSLDDYFQECGRAG